MQEKVREFVDDLVKAGKVSDSQGAKLVREWTEKAEKSSVHLSKSVAGVVSRAADTMHLASKEDVEKLSRKIQLLSARIKKLEGGAEDSPE